jgi:hypothetical protein
VCLTDKDHFIGGFSGINSGSSSNSNSSSSSSGSSSSGVGGGSDGGDGVACRSASRCSNVFKFNELTQTEMKCVPCESVVLTVPIMKVLLFGM